MVDRLSENGRQILLSTKTIDRKQAEAKLRTYEMIEQAEADGRLNDSFIAAITGKSQPATTLHGALRDFLLEAKGSTAERTMARYTSIFDGLQLHLQASESKPLLRDVGPDDIRGYLAKRLRRPARERPILRRKSFPVSSAGASKVRCSRRIPRCR